MIFPYDCFSLAELELCCQVAFSFSKANSKLDKDRQLWPSCNYFPADACVFCLPTHLLVNIPSSYTSSYILFFTGGALWMRNAEWQFSW